MRETKITAFLLGATILSSMGLSVPAFATSTNNIVDWIFDEVNTGQSTKYNMSASEKNQVIQEGTTWEVMDGYPINIPSKTITVDGNTASGQAIDGETIKGSIVYLNPGDTLGTLVVKNVGDMKVPSGIDPSNTEAIANYYSNPDNYNATNIGGYIQNLTDYLKNDDTIKDSAGADLDVSGVPAVRTENTNLTVQNNIFYNSSTVGASDSTTKDFGAGIVADNDLAKTATMNISQNTFIDNAAQGAGAAVNVEGNSNLNLTNNIFIRNSATGTSQNVGELIGHGGAVDFSGKVMTSSNNKFYQNTADESGGAIYIHGNTMVTSTNDTFVSNTTKQTNGGAILNTGNLTVQNGVFETNISKGSGGAIANDFVVTNFAGTTPTVVDHGSLTVSNSTFKGNRATDDNQNTTVVGGAILNVSTANLTSNTYTDNVADFGGAIGSEVSLAKEADGKIYDPPKVVLTSKNERFIGNKARQGGGAIFNAGNGIELSDGKIHFVSPEANLENVFMQDNIGGYEGGAIYNTGKMTITGGTIDSNKTDDDTRGSGGAIRNNVVGYRETQTGPVVGFVTGDLTVKDVTISNNISQLAGGGVQNTGTFKSSGNTYEGNSSKAGGAIYNETSSISNIGSGVTVPTGTLTSTNDTFKNNVASQTGGAIYNGTKAEAVIEGASFQGNQAAQGGAIYNIGKLTINNASTTAFKDNKATGGKGAAIYNASNGTVIIQGADDQIDLSYDPYLNQTDLNTGNPLPNPQRRLFGDNQDVYNEANATLTIQDSKLQLHHSKDLTKGVININKSETGTVNINNSQIDVGKAAVYGDTINVNKGSEMLVHLNTKDGEKGDLGKNFGGLKANTISVSDDDTAITIRVKAGEHMDKEAGPKEFKILDAETLNVVDNTGFATITKNHMYDIKYKGEGVYELTKVRPICPNGGCVHNAWVESEGEMDGHTKAQQIRELLNDLAQKYGCESKLYRDALDGIAPDVSPLIQAQATEVTQRLHGIISKQLYASMDRTGYVHRGKRFYRFPERKSRVWIQGVYGQSEYAGDKGFDMDTEGIALGFDKHIGKDTKLGLAYTYSKSTGTAVQRDTDVEAHTVAVYGEYNPDRFYSNWLALYSRSSYEENKKVYTERVKAEYDVDVFGGQIMFGNKMGPFVVGDWASGVLSPEIGLRYTYIKQHGYTDSAGQKVSDADGHVLTGILGAQYTIGYTLTPSIAWYPELRAAITYDFLEPDLENSVTLVNGSRYDVVTENLDKFGIEIGARVGLDINRKAEIALEYEGVFKGDYTNHTGLASLKYKF